MGLRVGGVSDGGVGGGWKGERGREGCFEEGQHVAPELTVGVFEMVDWGGGDGGGGLEEEVFDGAGSDVDGEPGEGLVGW